jgi:DNA-binding CsgD family transcriptional regulator
LSLCSDNQGSSGPRSLQPLGIGADLRNKRIALKRLLRLCSAGMPMANFAMTVFDVVGDAIPHGDIRIMTGDFENHRWFTNVDISSWASTFARLLQLPSELQGITMTPGLLERKELWRHEELEIGSFERSAGYNEFARHIGFHHVLSLMLRGPDGRLGNYPIWRSRDMRPFSREDRKFAAAILPHLNHALALAAYPGDEVVEGDNGFSMLGKHQLGLVSIDAYGRVLAANRAAQAIFYSLLANDESQRNHSGCAALGDSLGYLAGVLRKIFLASGGPEPDTPEPVVRMMNHPSGYQLRMRGYAADGEASKVFFVTVEAGETADRLAKRIMYRYGLNRTQAELLTLLANRPASRPVEIAALLNVRPDTLKKSLRRLADRLDLDSQHALRSLSRGIVANNGTLSTSLPQAG